jgi:hypothetical protein
MMIIDDRRKFRMRAFMPLQLIGTLALRMALTYAQGPTDHPRLQWHDGD